VNRDHPWRRPSADGDESRSPAARRSAIWRTSVDDEVDSELAFHVEMRTRELEARGMSRGEAREIAIRRFGSIDDVNAACKAIGRQRDKDMKRREYLSECLQDLRFAARQLIANPGFTIVSLLTLALGIGATAAIFSVVQAVVLRPIPVADPGRVVVVYSVWSSGMQGSSSAGNYVDVVEPVGAFAATSAMQYASFNVAIDQQAQRVVGAHVTAGFFDVWGIQPALGRVFTRDDDQPGGTDVVVLSHRFWMDRFAADRAIVGKRIPLNGRPHEVVGVMPADLDFTAQTEALWVPMRFTAARKTMHDEHQYSVHARLKPGATIEQAIAEMSRNAEGVRAKFPRDLSGISFAAIPVMDEIVGDHRRRLFIVLGAVGFVLLIACGNIANLLLARGAARSGELAVRIALGAGRARIVRQLLTESALMALLASVAGLAIAWWGVKALTGIAPPGIPRLERAAIDGGVLAFTAAMAFASAIVFGLAPALRAARTDLHGTLKEGGRGAVMDGIGDRLRTGVMIGEVALALVLLVSASLLIRSGLALQRVDPGFEPAGVLAARLALPGADYRDVNVARQTFERIVERAAAIPGVSSAAFVSQAPFSSGGNGNGLVPEGVPPEPQNRISSRLRIVSPGYFETMRISITRGRGLTASDRRGGLKVMVISEALARAAFGDRDPIGKRMACCEPGPDGKSPDYKTVVGVVADVRSRGLGLTPEPEFYMPATQVPDAAWDWIQRTMYVVVRTTGDPLAMSTPLRGTVASIAPGVALFDIRSMEQRIGASLQTAQFNTLLLSILGAIGVVLAVVGIYGVVAYFVTRRTREIGVRVALGASTSTVIRMIVRQAAIPVGIGIAIGVVAAALTTQLLSAQLFGVSPGDPPTYALVASLLAAVAVIASLVPAARAANADPTKALRSE
jgi:putative ABC transport system permease protein